jgi:hypothetical protein
MKSPARRFTLFMVTTSVLLVGAAVLLNYFVDPYDRFGNNRFGIHIFAEREVKAAAIQRFPHSALLLGNSRIAFIPSSPLKGFRFFNASFAAANPEEIYWFLHHHAHGQEVVVIGADVGTVDPTVLNGDIFRRDDWAAAADNLLNLQTLEYSFKTMFAHWAGKPGRYLPDGSKSDWDAPPNANRYDAALRMAVLRFMEKDVTVLRPRAVWSLSYYRKIAEMLRARKIACVVVLPPFHEEYCRLMDRIPGLREFQKAWMDELRTIFPNIVDLTSSPYGVASNFDAADPIHYLPETGVRFMNEAVVPFAKKVLGEQNQ